MQSTKKQISKNRIKLTVTVEPEKMTGYFDSHYNRLAPSVNLPGFRSGHAPRVMTIEAIGQARLAQQAIDSAVDEAYRQALGENKIFPVTQPSLTISKYPKFSEDKKENELVFEIEFDVLPEVKLGNWKKIKVKKVDPKTTVVSEQEVEDVIAYLRRQKSKLIEIDRGAKIGDWLEINFEGKIKNVVKDKLKSDHFPFILGEAKFIPGFEDKLIGLKKGDKKEFELTFPKDYHDKDVAGEKVKFAVECLDVKEVDLPALDGEFIKSFGAKSVKEFHLKIKQSLEIEKRERELQIQKAQITDQLVKLVKVDLPKSMIEAEKNRMKTALEQDLSQKGLTLAKYMENLKIDEAKMDVDLEDQAKRNILVGIGLGEIAKSEKIELTGPEGINKVFEFLVSRLAK